MNNNTPEKNNQINLKNSQNHHNLFENHHNNILHILNNTMESNWKLSDDERIKKAEQILGKELWINQQNTILKFHEKWSIWRQVKIIDDEILSNEDIEKLEKSGVLFDYTQFFYNSMKRIENIRYKKTQAKIPENPDFTEQTKNFFKECIPETLDFFSEVIEKNPKLITYASFRKMLQVTYIEDLKPAFIFLQKNNIEPTSENILKNFITEEIEIRGNYLENFCSEIDRFEEETGIIFNKNLKQKLKEMENSGFSSRYWNGFASFTRNISYLVNRGKFLECFENIDINKLINIKIFTSENPYIQEFIKLIKSIITSWLEKQEKWYTYFNSGLSARDKSCKDAESYFCEILEIENEYTKWNFRKIGEFIEKNLNKEPDRRTAINTKDVIVNGITYPRGYLFRLNTNWDTIISVEPIRMTIFTGGNQTKKFGQTSFWTQYKEFINHMDIYYPENTDFIDEIEKKI